MVLWSCSRDFSPITPDNNSPPDGNKPSIIVGEPVKIVERGHSPQWSRDGKRIAYVASSDASENIFITSDTGGVAFQVTQLDSTWPIWTPCWSPDDKTIAFTAIIKNAPGNGKVFSVPAAGGSITQLTPDSLFVAGCDWSPDGNDIIFNAQARDGAVSLYRIHLVDRKVTRVTSGYYYDGWPKYSPDGKRITFESSRSQPHQVWSCLADGSGLKQITEGGGDFPSWSPNGEWIVFCSDRYGNYDIFIVPREGGTEIRITDSPNHEVRPVWAPNGKTICFDTNPYPSEQGVWTVTLSNFESLKMKGVNL